MDDRALTLLDESGDTTITWSEDAEDKILPIIEQKMKEGCIFYIVKPMPIVKTNRFVKAKSVDEVRKAGQATIKDEALELLFLAGTIGVTKTPTSGTIDAVRKAANANDVVTNHSVAVRPARGG